MSRAFINKGEQWSFCEKSGDHCMYAEPGKECHQEDCEFINAKPSPVSRKQDKVVRRQRKSELEKEAKTAPKERPRATKRAAALGNTSPAMRRQALEQLKKSRNIDLD